MRSHLSPHGRGVCATHGTITTISPVGLNIAFISDCPYGLWEVREQLARSCAGLTNFFAVLHDVLFRVVFGNLLAIPVEPDRLAIA